MLVPILLFAVGLVLLIKGGDWFVDGACGIAKRFHLPEILIGATVVSIGTTLPEVMVSATAAAQGEGEIAYGNAIGSIICNTSLIAALTVAIRPSKINKKPLLLPVCFFFAAAIFYSLVAYITGYFSRAIGLHLLGVFVVYMAISIRQAFKNPVKEEEHEALEMPDGEAVSAKKAIAREIVLLIIGAALIAVGARLLVNNGTIIAEKLGVPDSVIALTFVALGTSLPELVTAISSLAKGHGSLSLGNVIGANLFNLVLVSGVAVTVSPFHIPTSSQLAGMNTSLVVEIPLMFAVMAILTVPSLIRGKLSRVQGISLLAMYAAFCVFQFVI